MTLDTGTDLCHCDIITAPVPEFGIDAPCRCNGGAPVEISKSWGGARANSGGCRPGAGRPRKPTPIVIAAPDPHQPRWCVFATWGQAETSATSDLTRQGYETYLPMVAIRRRDPVILSKWHIVRVPYLSGYGFIRLTQSESREPVTATRGIREVLLRPDGRAAWVPDGDIEKMRSMDAARLELPLESGPALAVGTMVRVEDGAFAGHIGTVTECDGIKSRVDLTIFGRPTPIWFDRVAVAEVV